MTDRKEVEREKEFMDGYADAFAMIVTHSGRTASVYLNGPPSIFDTCKSEKVI